MTTPTATPLRAETATAKPTGAVVPKAVVRGAVPGRQSAHSMETFLWWLAAAVAVATTVSVVPAVMGPVQVAVAAIPLVALAAVGLAAPVVAAAAVVAPRLVQVLGVMEEWDYTIAVPVVVAVPMAMAAALARAGGAAVAVVAATSAAAAAAGAPVVLPLAVVAAAPLGPIPLL